MFNKEHMKKHLQDVILSDCNAWECGSLASLREIYQSKSRHTEDNKPIIFVCFKNFGGTILIH
jgi:hypothetical protein